MIDKKILSEILLELTLAIRFSKDYVGILQNTMPRYMRKLNCTMASILEQNGTELSSTYIIPEAYGIRSEWDDIIKTCFNLVQEKDEVFYYFTVDDKYYHLFKMREGRFLLLMRSRPFDRDVSLELSPIVSFLSQSLDMALESEHRVKAERLLIEERILLRTVIDHIPDAVYVKDREHKKVIANRVDVANMGFQHESQVIGKADMDVYEEGAALDSYFTEKEILATGKAVVEREEILRKKDHSSRYIISSKFPLFNEAQDIMGIVGIGRDVTEKKEANKELRLLSMVASQTTNSVIITDLDGLIEWVNEGFIRLSGYTLKEVKGKAPGHFLQGPKSDPSTIKIMREAIKNRQPFSVELINYTKDQREYWVQINCNPWKNEEDEITGFIAIESEISAQKEIEQKLHEAIRLTKSAQEAEKQFLTNMSHEIRTPLNAVIGMTNLLYDTSPSALQVDYLDTLNSSANFLLALISDVLDIAKIEAGEINVASKYFNLHTTLKTVHKTFSQKAQSKPINYILEVEDGINGVIGDEKLLQQILNNIIGNAEKFTENGQIKLSASIEKQDEDSAHIKFIVADTGIGIASENIDKIFEKFKQVGGEKGAKTKGTGLGLSITKQLIEIQNGTIQVESKEGIGTAFTFVIPYINGKEETASTDRIIDSNNDQKLVEWSRVSILIVEDNNVNQKYISTLMRKLQLNYTMVNNGQEAVDICKSEVFDIILMDLQMPVMNGYDATIHIRNSDNQNKNIPIIALTASAMKDQMDKSIDSGMNDFLTKPFTPTQLKDQLSKYIYFS